MQQYKQARHHFTALRVLCRIHESTDPPHYRPCEFTSQRLRMRMKKACTTHVAHTHCSISDTLSQAASLFFALGDGHVLAFSIIQGHRQAVTCLANPMTPLTLLVCLRSERLHDGPVQLCIRHVTNSRSPTGTGTGATDIRLLRTTPGRDQNNCGNDRQPEQALPHNTPTIAASTAPAPTARAQLLRSRHTQRPSANGNVLRVLIHIPLPPNRPTPITHPRRCQIHWNIALAIPGLNRGSCSLLNPSLKVYKTIQRPPKDRPTQFSRSPSFTG